MEVKGQFYEVTSLLPILLMLNELSPDCSACVAHHITGPAVAGVFQS